MVSMLQPVRFDKAPIGSRGAVSCKALLSIAIFPLEPVGTTGPILTNVKDGAAPMAVSERTGTAVWARRRSPVESQTGQTLISIGGILGAIGAASCCLVPFTLFTLGIGGAWIGNLTALAPYQPIFAAVTLGLLVWGFYLVYGKPKP